MKSLISSWHLSIIINGKFALLFQPIYFQRRFGGVDIIFLCPRDIVFGFAELICSADCQPFVAAVGASIGIILFERAGKMKLRFFSNRASTSPGSATQQANHSKYFR